MKNIFLILLIALLKGISANEIAEQQEIAYEVDLENEEKQQIITAAPQNPKRTAIYKEVRKKIVKHNNKPVRLLVQRQSRDLENGTYFQGMECFSCLGHITSDLNCYKASLVSTQKCADFEQCFTELHPQYIKRGCISPFTINRTFVCKCPLCNDKPSQDSTHYQYRSFSDWLYDNKRLQKPVTGLDLICKFCETKGVKTDDDISCKEGRNTDYTICGQNQICYTNMDREINFVSRGCIDLPAYNAMVQYCNKTKCNNEVFDYPKIEKLISHSKFTGSVREQRSNEITENKASFNLVDNIWQIFISFVHITILF